MHIPLITTLTAQLLPFFSTQPTTTPAAPHSVTLRPIHAHGHRFHGNDTRPQLLFQDATHPSSFISLPPTSLDGEEVYLDRPKPDIASESLIIRTKVIKIRRPLIKPPSMTSWGISAQYRRRRKDTSEGRLPPLPIGTRGDNASEVWRAPNYEDEAENGVYDGWEDVDVVAPDVHDRQTLITLAKMTSDAYTTPDQADWYPLGKHWNATTPFGWEPDSDGLRGHIFADPTNSTVVISIKGTSAGVLGSGGPTAKNDKYNDNLLFSCCCARVDFSWTPVCDCYAGGYKCQQTCLEDALVNDSVYATVGTNLYNNVTYMYPNASIWLVGHSLGGSLAALVGLSFGAPALTVEAPGDRLPASRLHLPLPPGMPAEMTGITHVYHTADPIPMGACTGTYSGCYAVGFAMESSCHTGQTILYDTVTVKGWAVDVRTHRIGEVINKVLADPWPVGDELKEVSAVKKHTGLFGWWPRRGPPKDDKGHDDGDDWDKHGGVPAPKAESNCTDCYKWEFGEHQT